MGQLALDRDSWRFELAGDRLLAVAVGRARHAELAGGALGEGTAGDGERVDVTPLFPRWVKEVLAAQVATGAVIVQPDPTQEPAGYSGLEHDLGYGNCHGFTARLFGLFDDVRFTAWKRDGEPDVFSPPAGAPLCVRDVDPSYQVVQVQIGVAADTPLGAWAQRYRISHLYPPRWAAVVELGRRLFVGRVRSARARAVAVPGFGDLGVAAEGSAGFQDHSLIALGPAGAAIGVPGARIYTLQKMHPLGVYAVCVWRLEDYDWYRFPRGFTGRVT